MLVAIAFIAEQLMVLLLISVHCCRALLFGCCTEKLLFPYGKIIEIQQNKLIYMNKLSSFLTCVYNRYFNTNKDHRY